MNMMRNDKLRHKNCFYFNKKCSSNNPYEVFTWCQALFKVFIGVDSFIPHHSSFGEVVLLSHFTDGPLRHRRGMWSPGAGQLADEMDSGVQAGSVCVITVLHHFLILTARLPRTSLLSAVTWHCYVVLGKFIFVCFFRFMIAKQANVLMAPINSPWFFKINIKAIWKMIWLKVSGSSECKNLSNLY